MTQPKTHWAAPDWLRAFPDPLPAWIDERPQVPWNLAGMLRGWAEHPQSMDFLDVDSPNYAWKGLQTRLYRSLLDDILDPEPPRPLRILDAACGIGRFLVPLAAAGHEVVGIDACEPSLRAANRHLSALVGDGPLPTLIWGDVEDLSEPSDLVPDNSFDVVLAIELLCYLSDPVAVARSLARRLKPGGHLVVSVEAWPGALLVDPQGIDTAGLGKTVENRVLAVPMDRWVRPVDEGELASILQAAGLGLCSSWGTHYLLDGPLMHTIDTSRVGEADYDDEVLRLEAALRESPHSSTLARAWLAVAQAPGSTL